MPGRRGPRVVSIDAERTVETDADKLRNDLLDLVERSALSVSKYCLARSATLSMQG